MERETIIEAVSALVAISVPFAAATICLMGGLVGVGVVVVGYLVLTLVYNVAIRRAIYREDQEVLQNLYDNNN